MRESGILLPVASLPGLYGIGTMGQEARAFVDFLAAAGQSVWQILPIGPTGYGDSPYQSFSAFAGNPYFIDPEQLCKEGLLTEAECKSARMPAGAVDYARLFETRFTLLRKAADRFLQNPTEEWNTFCREETWWVDDYAMYMTAKNLQKLAPLTAWPEPLRRRWGDTMGALWFDNQPEINFYKFMQFAFFSQWKELKSYANEKGVKIFGDLPIYVSADSADVWARADLFLLDEDGLPAKVSGVPPDAFSANGQLWGNPLYHWPAHEKEGFDWWARRIQKALTVYDILRIDHFRGFDSYWAVNAKADTAKDGAWCEGPGMKLFDALAARLGDMPIVAEDLGILTDSVRQLLKHSGYPGMKVLQFAFGSGAANEYLPHNHIPHSVVYTGTHDNTTTADWFQTEPKAAAHARAYLGIHKGDNEVLALVKAAEASCAELCVLPVCDLLELGRKGRINEPGTTFGNWSWRLTEGQLTEAHAKKLRAMCEMYGRAWPQQEPEKTNRKGKEEQS